MNSWVPSTDVLQSIALLVLAWRILKLSYRIAALENLVEHVKAAPENSTGTEPNGPTQRES